MLDLSVIITILSCSSLACGGIALVLWRQNKGLNGERARLWQDNQQLSEAKATLLARLEDQEKYTTDRLKTLEDAEERLENIFKATSQAALESSNKLFLELAQSSFSQMQQSAEGSLKTRHEAFHETLKPLKESLLKVDQKIQDLEHKRVGAYESLVQQVRGLLETGESLRKETHSLATALRAPASRGRWGELQLKRVVEMAGMLDHCDFYEQVSDTGAEGRKRPDMVVRLPGNKNVVVDAKVPLVSYLEAHETSDESVRNIKMLDHAAQVKRHINSLSQKSYWEQFKPAPEFVILFLPSEGIFSAALEQDGSLIEHGVNQKVIVATPTTLIALLRAVAYGWRGEAVNQNAMQIAELGKTLYARVSDLSSHLGDLGRHLGNSVKSFNKTVGTVERRVLVTARRFEELQCHDAAKPLNPLEAIEPQPRDLTDTTAIPSPKAAVDDAETSDQGKMRPSSSLGQPTPGHPNRHGVASPSE